MGAGVTPRVVELLFWERPWSYVETSEALTGALARLGDPRAVEPLRELLTTASEPRIRRSCADALGQGSFREAWDVLVRGMDDPVEEVRLACARALGRLRDERSAPALVAMLSRDDISADLKGVAMRALAKTAGDLAATTLARYIDVGAAAELVMDAIDALARTDSSTAIPVLEGLLDHPTPEVRPAAARSLERLRRRLGAS
nr:HEAT repeat domain-containing protein [Nannocystis sp. SCPEA4]